MRCRLVFTAYRRPHYFAEVLDAWTQVRGFAEWKPAVYLEPSPVEQEMAELATAAGLRVHLNMARLGVLSNPWQALEGAFTGHGDPADAAEFAVLAEDDLLPSTDILEFFTWAATSLRGVDFAGPPTNPRRPRRVLTVCAASLAPAVTPEQQHDVTLSGTFCSQIWGTWAGNWTAQLRDTWDHDYSSAPPGRGNEAGWDWNIYRRLVPGCRVAHPVASRVTHIGRFGGAHTTEASFPGSQLPTFAQHRPPGQYRLVPLRDGDAPTP